MRGGQLRDRVTFQKRAAQTGHVRTLAAWADVVTGWAAAIVPVAYSSGESEEVQSERLTGVGLFTVTVRYAPELAGISTAWRVLDDATGEGFNIRHINLDVRGRSVVLTCDQGRDSDT
jgi:head-tail adaptor